MPNKNNLFIGLIALISLAVLGGVGYSLGLGGAGRADERWAKIQREKVLVVAIDPSYPPFAIYGDPEPIGLDADLAHALAEKLGVTVRFSWQGYDGLYDTLLLHHADVVISALHPDSSRTQDILYSPPYADAGQVFVTLPATTSIGDWSELAGQRLAVEFASEGDSAAQKYLAQHPNAFTLQRLLSAEEALQAVVAGTAETALVDRISAGAFGQNLTLSAPIIPDLYVVAVYRKDWTLALEVNRALVELEADGTLDALVQKWFLTPPVLD
jgi:polar amino acid transport system substrate-binding protein